MNLIDKASVVAGVYTTAFEEYWAKLPKTLPQDVYTFCLEERDIGCQLSWLVAFGYFPVEHLPDKAIEAIEEVYDDMNNYGWVDTE